MFFSTDKLGEREHAHHQIGRLKPGNYAGHAVIDRYEPPRACADNRAYVAGQYKPVDPHLAGREERSHRGRRELVSGKDGEVFDAAIFCLNYCGRLGRGSGLKAHRKEHDILPGV